MVDGLIRKAVAESFGAFVIVFSTVVVTNLGWTPRALIYGFVVAGLVAGLGHVSGGHFNPAVTLAILLARRIDVASAVVYWVAQVVGGVVAAWVIVLSTNSNVLAIGTPVIADEPVDVSMGGAITVEAIATMAVVMVVFGTIVDSRAPVSVYPFAIGLTYSAGVMVSGPLTGGSLNPVRGFGPALVGGDWGGLGAWLAGPLIGAVLAWALYTFVISDDGMSMKGTGRTSFPEQLPPPPGPSLM